MASARAEHGGLTLERYAELTVFLRHAGERGRARILAAARVTEPAWAAAEAGFRGAIEDEMACGGDALVRRFAAARERAEALVRRPRVQVVTPDELAARRAAGLPVLTFDMRTDVDEDEALPRALPYDLAARRTIPTLDRHTPLAFACHNGARSRWVAEHWIGEGFVTVFDVRVGPRRG